MSAVQSRAWQLLGLPETATPEQVKARWRELAAIHHPDRGGNAVDFTTYRRAYQEALREAEVPKPCKSCKGLGKQKVSHGFYSTEVVCPQCKGAGHT